MKSRHKKGKDEAAMPIRSEYWAQTAFAHSAYRAACLGAVLAMLSCPGWGRVWAQADHRSAEQSAAGVQYRYDPAGKRDPFSSPSLPLSGSVEPSAEPQTPLQGIELGQLRLVGIVVNIEHSRALIEDHTGFAYVVSPGTLIGSRGGVVKAIEPRRVIVEEYETDLYGTRQRTQRELKLVAATAASAQGKKR